MRPARAITATTPADLIDKVYRAEGWTKVEGEVRARRVKTLYTLTRDNRANRYVATPKEGV
jgi:hypothetical protein